MVKVIRDERFPRIVVQNANIVKKHIQSLGNQTGFIVSLEAPMHYSNVMLVDPVTNKPVRTRFAYLEDGSKVSVASLSPFLAASIIDTAW